MRILIADDDRDTIMTLGILLRSEGHEVCLAQRPEEVAGAVREFKPKVVLLDIGMPGRSGYEIAHFRRGEFRGDKSLHRRRLSRRGDVPVTFEHL